MNTPIKEATAATEKIFNNLLQSYISRQTFASIGRPMSNIIQSAIEKTKQLPRNSIQQMEHEEYEKSRAAQPQRKRPRIVAGGQPKKQPPQRSELSVSLTRSPEEQAEIESGIHSEPPQEWRPEGKSIMAPNKFIGLAENAEQAKWISAYHNAAIKELQAKLEEYKEKAWKYDELCK